MLFLNTRVPETRLRFTLGHELGHLLIPWHVGTIECHADGEAAEEDEGPPATEPNRYQLLEREADRFASRVLVPARFLGAIGQLPAPTMLRELARAGMSAAAGLRALVDALPPGYLFVLLGADRQTVGTALTARSARVSSAATSWTSTSWRQPRARPDSRPTSTVPSSGRATPRGSPSRPRPRSGEPS